MVKNIFQKEFVLSLLLTLFSNDSSQPEVSKYCGELMPLLLGYLSSLDQAKVGHVTKAFYALENFMENLGKLKKFMQWLTEYLSSENLHPLPTARRKSQLPTFLLSILRNPNFPMNQ